MKSIIRFIYITLFFSHVFLVSETGLAAEKIVVEGWKNFYGIIGNTKLSEDITNAKQMGYDCIVINPSVPAKDYRKNPDCAGLKFYLTDPYWHPYVLSGYPRDIDTTKPVSDTARDFYHQHMVWKSNDAFPYNLATGYHPAGTSTKFSVMWDFQQQAVIDEVIEKIIRAVKKYEDRGLSFTFGGYIFDEPRLAGEFYTVDEKGNNMAVSLSSWTGEDAGLVHDNILHEYATYTDGRAAFYKQLFKRTRAEWPDMKVVMVHNDIYRDWVEGIQDRIDGEELMPDALFQKSSGTAFVDNEQIFVSDRIMKNSVGTTQHSEQGEEQNRLYAAKAAINGAWYNWFGSADLQGVVGNHSRLKLIRCLPNWDNLNNVSLVDREWDGSVYQSTKSYASSDVIYSRYPKTGEIFAVFLTTQGVVKLDADEMATAVRRTDSFFHESGDGSDDVIIAGDEIRLGNADYIGKGYIFTVSPDSNSCTIVKGLEVNGTSDSEGLNETENADVQPIMGRFERRTTRDFYSSELREKNTQTATIQQLTSTQTWQQVPLRTKAQVTAGVGGGEGMQVIFSLVYARSNLNGRILYSSTDTSQIWKSVDGGTTWQMKHTGFKSNGAVSLGVHPSNENIVYAAGSAMLTDGSTSGTTQGIYRTTNGGDSWTLVKVATYSQQWYQRGGDLFAFSGANTIYAGTHNEGILKSTDGGNTWTALKDASNAAIFSGKRIADIELHPSNAGILYACVFNDGLYKLTLGASTTKTKIGTGLPATVNEMEIDHSNADIMYMTTCTYGVYKSTNGGLNFSAKNNGLTSSLDGTTRAYFLDISSANPNYIYLGMDRNRFFYTHNGGENWYQPTTMDVKNTDGWVAGSVIDDVSTGGSGWGGAAVAAHPTNRDIALIAGSAYHVKKTTDGGVNFRYSSAGFSGGRVGSLPNNAKAIDIIPISWDISNPSRFAVFLEDYGAFLTEDGGATFKNLRLPRTYNNYTTRAGAIQPIANSQTIVTAVGSWGAQVIAVTHNEGQTWALKSETDGAYQFIGYSPNNPNVVYAGNRKSTNNGDTWTGLSRSVKAIYPKATGSDILYAADKATGSEYTVIYKSTNGGSTWAAYPTLNIDFDYVGEIAIDPNNPDKIYLAARYHGLHILNNNVWSSGNGSGVNALPVHTDYGFYDTQYVAIDPKNSNRLYVGGTISWKGQSSGIYRSTNGGSSWEKINYNLQDPFTPWSLNVNPHDSTLFVGSSNGTWKLPPPSNNSSSDTLAPNCSVSINNGDAYTNSTTVTLSLSATDNVGVTGYYLSTSSSTPLASAAGWIFVTSTTNFSKNVSYTLSNGDGSKTVYVWYKDAAGNVSNPTSDSITLDTTVPLVTITSPTSSSTYTTSSNTISLGGSTSGDVISLTWSSNGDSGTASGITSWSISDVSLSSGDTIITVTARDGANNLGTDTITVTYTPGSIPQVTTGSASNVTTSSATLNGTVNANGLPTTVWFEYGTASGSYGSTSTTQSVSGTSDTTISIGINGLSVGTTYYYRVAAQNSAGTTYGTEKSFTTIADNTGGTNTTNSTQANYTFDEGSGTIAADSSGNGYNSTINGATWTSGKNGGGLSFDGINDYVSLPLEAATNAALDNIYTLSAWVYVSNTTDPQIIVSATDLNGGGDANTIMELSIYNGYLNFVPCKYSKIEVIINSPGWHHLVGVRDGSTAKLFVDGILQGTMFGLNGTTLSPLSFNLGKPHQNKYYFKGILDDVCIYNHALTDQEVIDLYNK